MEIYTPGTLLELQELRKKLNWENKPAAYLAGGTDLILQLRSSDIKPEILVCLHRLDELKGIDEENEIINIGAMTTFSQLATSKLIEERISVLGRAAASSAAPQVRNQGTIGGNIANGSPAADLVPPLLVLDSELEVLTDKGVQVFPLPDILKGVGETHLRPLDLIQRIKIKRNTGRGTFVKLGLRNSLVIARISLAMYVEEDSGGLIEHCALSLGAIAPTAIRAGKAEEIMRGKRPSLSLFAKVTEKIVEITTFYLGQRSSAPFKKEAIKGVMAEAFYKLYPELMEEGDFHEIV
ncbi:MAG: FAD binding domain-containing protein [Bacillota bacterium]